MPSHNDALAMTGEIADLRRRSTRHGSALAAVQIPQPAKQSWTVATNSTSPTLQLSYLPYNGTLGSSINLSWNDLEIREGTDYTVDYSTGLITLASGVISLLRATPTPADLLTVDYWTTGDLAAAAVIPDTGHGPGTYIGNATANGNSGGPAVATAPMPTGIAAGDLLLIFLNTSNADTVPTTPTGWTKQGTVPTGSFLVIYSKIAGASESTVNITLSGSQGWTTCVRAYRGSGMIVMSTTYGTAGAVASCALPSASVSGEPTLVECWAAYHGFSVNPVTMPAATQNQATDPNVTLSLATGDENLTGVTTTPSRTATSTLAEDNWTAAAVLVAST